MTRRGEYKYRQLGNREWLCHKYWTEDKSSPEIATIVGCHPRAVICALKRLNIPRKKRSEAQKAQHRRGETRFPELKDKKWLIDRYWGEDKTLEEIGQIIGCTASWVGQAMRELRIPRRTNSEVHMGKTASDVTKKKMSATRKGRKGHFFGLWPSEVRKKKAPTAQKGRKILKGEEAPRFGMHNSKEHNQKISQSQKGKKNSFFGKKHTDEAMIKMQEARKRQPKHHTIPELIFEDICTKYDLPFKYTGDSSFWIENMNPDFVECNGKKIVVEIFGDYWHSPLLQWNLREDRTLDYRKGILKKYGWKLIVFWETDLKREDTEQFVLATLKKEGVI